MTKKIALNILLCLAIVGYGEADDQKNDQGVMGDTGVAPPHVSYMVSQWAAFQTVNGVINSSDIGTDSALDESTCFKTWIDFDLGNGLKTTVTIGNVAEGRYNPGNLYENLQYMYTGIGNDTEQAQSTDVMRLGSIAIRNRFSFGIGLEQTFDRSFSLGADFVYRDQTYLQTSEDTYKMPVVTEQRLAFVPKVHGSIGGFYYNVWQGLYFYLDPTNGLSGSANPSNGIDNSEWETEGGWLLGYSVPLGHYQKLKFELDNYIDDSNFVDNANSMQNGYTQYFGFTENPEIRVVYEFGDVAPFIGAFDSYNSNCPTTYACSSNVVGGVLGATVKVGRDAELKVSAHAGTQTNATAAWSANNSSPYASWGQNGQLQTVVETSFTLRG